MKNRASRFVIIAAIAACLMSFSSQAETRTWRGTKSALASVADNWAESAVPTDGDDILFDAGSAAKPMTWDLDVSPRNWTQQSGYSGTVTFQTGRGGPMNGKTVTTHGTQDPDSGVRYVHCTGSVDLQGGVWTHAANADGTKGFKATEPSATDGIGVYCLDVRVDGTFAVGAAAAVAADACGFIGASSPGIPTATYGRSHGGSAAGSFINQNVLDLAPGYGDVFRPNTIGAGQGVDDRSGGGAVHVVSKGAMSVAGRISANAGRGSAYYQPAGGSVWIEAASLSGAGSIEALAPLQATGGPGGGGRIAVHLSGGQEAMAFTGEITAAGAACKTDLHGAPGTIYIETADDGEDGGKLIANGSGERPLYCTGTWLTARDAPYDFSTIELGNKGSLMVPEGATLRLRETTLAGGDANNPRITLYGGTLLVDDGYELKNCTVACMKEGSQIAFDTSDGTGTLLIGEGGVLDVGMPLTTSSIRVKEGGKITAPNTVWNKFSGENEFQVRSTRLLVTACEIVLSGDLTVDAGGAIDASFGGWAGTYGEDGGDGYAGGTYGGCAQQQYATTRPTCYGSIQEPYAWGSGAKYGGESNGSGIIKLTVNGTLTVNGKIGADGRVVHPTASDKYVGGGSGGSVWITTGRLAGTGSISANGGHRAYAAVRHPGGGGRVAVTLTSPDSSFSQFAGKITAYGGVGAVYNQTDIYDYFENAAPQAAAGTVYLRAYGQGIDEGTLIVDNKGAPVTGIRETEIGVCVTNATVGRVVVTNGASLVIRAGAELKVGGDFDSRGGLMCGEAADGSLPAGKVAFVDASSVSQVYGTNTFSSVVCAAPGKTVLFGTAADATRTVIADDGEMSFRGEGQEASERVTLGAAPAGTEAAWLLALGGGVAQDNENLRVDWSDASGGAMALASNATGDNNVNWKFFNVVVGETNVWTGTLSSSFAEGANWSLERAPNATDVLVVPSGCPNAPALVGDFAANEVVIADGATLSLAGRNLSCAALTVAGELVATDRETVTVAGNADFTGGSYVPARSTFVITGNAASTFDPAAQTFYVLSVAKTGGSLNIADRFACDRLYLTAVAGGAYSVAFSTSGGNAARELYIDGNGALSIDGDGSAAWRLAVADSAVVSGVNVANCTADGKVGIVARGGSQDLGGNVNWTFGTADVTWTGSQSDDFFDPENWAGGEVPGADDDVVIPAGATVRIASDAATVRSLTLAGGDAATLFSNASNVTVAGSVYLGRGVTWTADARVEAGNAFVIDDGAVVTHGANGNDAPMTKWVDIAVGGDFAIARSGKIDVVGKGYAQGPGKTMPGGLTPTPSHGGTGAYGWGNNYPAYGSVVNPFEPGSGAGSVGGGVVRLAVGGELLVEGEILATGGNKAQNYAGSGGSVWISASRLTGDGTISARGGSLLKDGTTDSAGAGGRIAVYLVGMTEAQAEAAGGKAGEWFDGLITASGGVGRYVLPDSFAGSVFYSYSDTAEDGGVILADLNGGIQHASTARGGLELPVTVDGDSPRRYRQCSAIVRDGGSLYLTADLTMDDLELSGSASKLYLNGHTLTLLSRKHRRRKGWTGTVIEDGGTVRWESGLMIILR